MSRRLCLLIVILFLLGLANVVSAGTLFTENFGTSGFTKSQWTETNSQNVVTNLWLGDTSLPPSTTGYSAKLTSNSVATLLTMTNGINTTGAKEVIISLWVKRAHANTDYVDLWANSSSAPTAFTSIASFMTDTINTWTSHTITLTADSYMFDGFKIRLRGRTNGGSSGNRYVWYDEISISTTYQAISGTVGTLEGVLMDGLPGNPVTGVGGAYTANVGYNWSGTVTPVLAGYAFNPVNRTYSNVNTSQTDQNYTPEEAVSRTVSGSVGTLEGVTMVGLPGSPVTANGGTYTCVVNQGWGGTVTPTKAGYTFTPVNKTYSNVVADVTGENYSPDPTKANTPSPVNGLQYEKTTVSLSWTAGNIAVSHDVYVGTNIDDVTNATNSSQLCVSPAQTATTFSPVLANDVTYYWRIDENYDTGFATGTLKGDVWSFKTIEESAADPNLLGWWKLDDATGSMAWDYSGNGRNGTFTGGAYIVADDVRGNVVSLDGVDDCVKVTGYKAILGANPRSISAWIKTAKTGANYQGIAAWGNNSGSQSWDFVVYNSKLRQMIYNNNADGSTNVADGNWHHVASVYAGGNLNTVKLYVDGVAETVTSVSATPNTTSSINRSFMFGNTDSLGSRYFQGMIDDVRLYNRALSEVEVRAAAGNSAACSFSPAYGATTVTTVLLDWDSAAVSPKYNVYFSSDFDDVNDSVPSALKGDGITDSNYQTSGLAFDTTYYWAVDVNDGGTMFPADTIMSFHTAKPYADNPSPVNGMKCVPIANQSLSWTPSTIMTSQAVYFGTSSVLVADKDNSVLLTASTTASTYPLGTLADGVTYYWLVDTTSSQGTSSIGVWSFSAIAIADPNLVAWWNMEEDNATYAWDYSGHGHHATKHGASSIISDGQRGNVMDFSGTAGDYLNAGSWASATKNMTYCSWFKVDTFTKNVQCLIGNDGSYRLSRTGLENTIRLYNDSPLQGSMGGTSNVNDGQWHHACGVVDNAAGTTTTVTLYVDGKIENSITKTGTMKPLVGSLYIGGDGTSYPNREWDGQADDIRIYNKALNAFDVAKLAGRGPNHNAGDINNDGKVTFDDVIKMTALLNNYGQMVDNKQTIQGSSQYYNPIADINGDGMIRFNDLVTLTGWINSYGVNVARKLTIMCPHNYGL